MAGDVQMSPALKHQQLNKKKDASQHVEHILLVSFDCQKREEGRLFPREGGQGEAGAGRCTIHTQREQAR